MYKIMTADNMIQEFEWINRKDMFTWSGCKAIIDYYDKCYEDSIDIEFNPYDILSQWTEYGKTTFFTIEDMLDDYGYLIGFDVDITDIQEREAIIIQLINYINKNNYAVRLKNGNVLIMDF